MIILKSVLIWKHAKDNKPLSYCVERRLQRAPSLYLVLAGGIQKSLLSEYDNTRIIKCKRTCRNFTFLNS